jgi:ribosomal protein L29
MTAKKSSKSPEITKKVDYSQMKNSDIAKKITELKEEAAVLKRNMLIGDVQNHHAYILKRRELARALTAQKLNFNKEEN